MKFVDLQNYKFIELYSVEYFILEDRCCKCLLVMYVLGTSMSYMFLDMPRQNIYMFNFHISLIKQDYFYRHFMDKLDSVRLINFPG